MRANDAMQCHRRLVGLVAAAAAIMPASGLQLGPEGCVSLVRSPMGTCVIRTNCEGVNTEGFEFALDCENGPDDIVRHSFGFGGFDAVEEFDTSIACKHCNAVDKDPEAVVAEAEQEAEEVDAKKDPTPASQSEEVDGTVVLVSRAPPKKGVAKYGPGKCVSTWKDQNTSRCIMQTKCQKSEVSGYEYGLICEDEKGNQIQHLFGTGSFEMEETFDTLIVCDKCRGMDGNFTAAPPLNATEVQELADNVKKLDTRLKNIAKQVTRLNEKVATWTTTKAPSMLHSAVRHHKQLRGKKVRKTRARIFRKARGHHLHQAKSKPAAKTTRRSLKHRKHPNPTPAADDEELG